MYWSIFAGQSSFEIHNFWLVRFTFSCQSHWFDTQNLSHMLLQWRSNDWSMQGGAHSIPLTPSNVSVFGQSFAQSLLIEKFYFAKALKTYSTILRILFCFCFCFSFHCAFFFFFKLITCKTELLLQLNLWGFFSCFKHKTSGRKLFLF